MTLEEYIPFINALPAKIENAAIEAVIVPSANVMLGSIINRNVNEGLNTDGSKRGGYSTKPMYASRSQFITKSFSPQGKGGKKVKDNGQPYKTEYLPQGYQQLRQKQGREIAFKNYEYTGDMFLAFGLAPAENEVQIGFRTEKASIKRKSLEKRFGITFKPSQGEIDRYKTEVTEHLGKLQNDIILGVV